MKINTICKDCSRNLQICTCMDDTIDIKQNKMEIGQTVRIKSTQEIGTIIEINGESVKVYIPKRGTFKYIKSNLELVEKLNNN